MNDGEGAVSISCKDKTNQMNQCVGHSGNYTCCFFGGFVDVFSINCLANKPQSKDKNGFSFVNIPSIKQPELGVGH